MLKKKFYTQRFVSQGPMNQNAVTPSMNFRLNRLKRCLNSVEVSSANFKEFMNRDSSSRTERIKRCVFERSVPSTHNISKCICTNRVPQGPSSIRNRRIFTITKDIGFKSSSEYLKEKKSGCNNDLPEPLRTNC